MGVDLIMKSSLVRKTLDNITVLFIGFENFENFINKKLKDIEGYKKENLKTEEPKLSRKISEGKDTNYISTSSIRMKTENIVINSDEIFNRTSKNKEFDHKDGYGNGIGIKIKANKLRINIDSIEADINNKEISSGFDKKSSMENPLNLNSPKRNKMVLDKIKNDNINKLPQVLYTENNFR
jgi:hypothetical protein